MKHTTQPSVHASTQRRLTIIKTATPSLTDYRAATPLSGYEAGAQGSEEAEK